MTLVLERLRTNLAFKGAPNFVFDRIRLWRYFFFDLNANRTGDEQTLLLGGLYRFVVNFESPLKLEGRRTNVAFKRPLVRMHCSNVAFQVTFQFES